MAGQESAFLQGLESPYPGESTARVRGVKQAHRIQAGNGRFRHFEGALQRSASSPFNTTQGHGLSLLARGSLGLHPLLGTLKIPRARSDGVYFATLCQFLTGRLRSPEIARVFFGTRARKRGGYLPYFHRFLIGKSRPYSPCLSLAIKRHNAPPVFELPTRESDEYLWLYAPRCSFSPPPYRVPLTPHFRRVRTRIH